MGMLPYAVERGDGRENQFAEAADALAFAGSAWKQGDRDVIVHDRRPGGLSWRPSEG